MRNSTLLKGKLNISNNLIKKYLINIIRERNLLLVVNLDIYKIVGENKYEEENTLLY
jgi:hypothetical protein